MNAKEEDEEQLQDEFEPDVEEHPETGQEYFQELDMEKPVERIRTGNFVDRQEILTFDKPKMFIIVKPGRSQYDKPVLKGYWEPEDPKKQVSKDDYQILNISKTNLNTLIDIFGNNPKRWIGRGVMISGRKWVGSVKNEEGVRERREGVILTLAKP